MASDAIVGALRILIGADSAGLNQELDKSSAKLSTFGSNIGKIGLAIGAGLAAGAAALGYAVSQSVDKIDNLGKAAQKAGAPIEDFSKLASSAGKVKIGVDDLAGAMEKLGKNMSAIAGGGATTDAGRAFQALGISVKDASGNLKSSSDVVSELAGKFASFQDSPAKTALAISIFGKAGAEMIPLLNQGSAGLKKTADEMERLGLVIDDKTYKSAEQFNQSLTRLGKVKDSIILKLTVGMLPALNDVSDAMVQVSKDTQGLQSVSDGLASVFKVGAEIGIVLATVIQRVAAEFAPLGKAIGALVHGDFFNFAMLMGQLDKETQQTDTTFAALHDRLENMWSKPATDGVNYNAVLDQVEASMNAIANVKLAAPVLANTAAIDKFVASTEKSLAAQNAETATVGMAAGAKEKLRVVLQGLEVATANHIPITDALRARLDALGTSAGDAALKLAGTQLVFANKDPLTQYQIELANTELAMRAVGATADELARNQLAVGQKFGMTWSAIGTNIAGTAGALSQLTGTFAQENKAMGIASKAFGIGQAIINTQIAITKALATLPPPASYVAVGLAVAQGAAAVASIAAQKFKTGASFMVPGGVGGGDRMPFSAMLEPGERVDITPADQVSSRSQGGVLEVRGIRSRDFWTGDMVRDLVGGLIEHQRNGGAIVLKPA